MLKFVRQERNADIFSLTSPIILNGFEIGIYLRAREDRKVQIIGKCKNMIVNKTGFDKASLTFNLKVRFCFDSVLDTQMSVVVDKELVTRPIFNVIQNFSQSEFFQSQL